MNLELNLDLNKKKDESLFTENDQKKTFSVKVEKEEFYEAISLVSKATSRNSIQPILSAVYLEADQEKSNLRVCSTDLDLAILVEVKAKVDLAGRVALPAQKVQELLSKLPKQSISIESDQEQNIKLVSGRTKFDLKGFLPEEFPKESIEIEETEKKIKRLNFPVGHLKRIPKLVSFATEKREINNILNGICIEVNKENIEIGATDGSRLAYYKSANFIQAEQQEQETEIYQKAIIPFRAFNEISRLIQDLEDQATIELNLSEDTSKISLQLSQKFLSSSLIEGDYPQYQQLIPREFSKKATLDREEFLESIERVSVLANEKNRIVKLFFQENKTLSISANTPQLGEAQDQIDLIDYFGEDFTVALNVNFITECLRGLDSKQIQLNMKKHLDPVILQPVIQEENDPESSLGFEYTYLLMPIQTKSLDNE